MAAVIGKFRGCLLGTLIGDCFGAPFEGDFPVSKSVLRNFIAQKMNPDSKKGSMQMLPYTDDTAMAKGVAQSLIDKNGFDAADMAKKFCENFYEQPKRGYGANVIDVFHALKVMGYTEPFEPAKAQFNGTGSYGNGAAMRIAPVPIFHFNSEEDCIKLADQSAKITHSHQHGYNGSILQSLAIHQALHLQPGELNHLQFVESLHEKMLKIEKDVSIVNLGAKADDATKRPYCTSLKTILQVLEEKESLSPEEIGVLLGNQISAHKSVPTAIYCFLRAKDPIETYETDNLFARTLAYSISVGGDTDTIAAMACSIAGAYVGIEGIPEILPKQCEDYEGIITLADRLHEIGAQT